VKQLLTHPSWPQIEFDPGALLPPDVSEGLLVGEPPPSLKNGLRVFRSTSTTGVRAAAPLKVPFGSEVKYDVVEKKPDGTEKRHDGLSLVVLGTAGTIRH